MKTRSSPGLSQWLVATIIVATAVFLLYEIYQYGSARQYFPAGLTIAGIDVGGMTREEAGEAVAGRYLESDVILYHGEDSISVSPGDIEFELDLETMLNQADFQRAQQDFWAGFWGFVTNRPIEVEMVELRATHEPDALRDVLETVAASFDAPAQPPQPLPTTMSFEYGEPGVSTDVDASVGDVVAAFYRPTAREAHLTLRPVQAVRPDMRLLEILIGNHLDDRAFSGVASIFILDLESGREIFIDAGEPMTGMELLKVPIVVDAYRMMDGPPSAAQMEMIDGALLTSEEPAANGLLKMIAGQDNAYLGAQVLTDSMWQLGLKNTFMAIPYGAGPVSGGRATYQTPANSASLVLTKPDPGRQTTAEDMGALLSMLYYCAERGGGPLLAAYPDQITQAECQQILDVMKNNQIGSLIEEGVPPGTPVAHRHSWVGDTHADAGIVYSPGGDYVLVEILYQPDWLPWERSSPLMADVSRAAYNYFNFDQPYLDSSRTN